jgi:protein translocase subunit secY/sec61 alpha
MSSLGSSAAGNKGGLSNMPELRSRLFFVLGALFVFRIGAHVPVPGIDPKALALMFEQQAGTILDMFNMFSGGDTKKIKYICSGHHAVYFGIYYYSINDVSCT